VVDRIPGILWNRVDSWDSLDLGVRSLKVLKWTKSLVLSTFGDLAVLGGLIMTYLGVQSGVPNGEWDDLPVK
jgi:hypothetical protein